jgi:LytTr DNA-binding domain
MFETALSKWLRNMERLVIDLILSVSLRGITHLKMTIQFILRIAKNFGVLPLNNDRPFIIASHSQGTIALLSMKKIEQKLSANKFMRVHRSYIVNLEKITTIERSRIIFNEEFIPVSEQYKERFQEFIDKNFLT